jgi:hypothetical protein
VQGQKGTLGGIKEPRSYLQHQVFNVILVVYTNCTL